AGPVLRDGGPARDHVVLLLPGVGGPGAGVGGTRGAASRRGRSPPGDDWRGHSPWDAGSGGTHPGGGAGRPGRGGGPRRRGGGPGDAARRGHPLRAPGTGRRGCRAMILRSETCPQRLERTFTTRTGTSSTTGVRTLDGYRRALLGHGGTPNGRDAR